MNIAPPSLTSYQNRLSEIKLCGALARKLVASAANNELNTLSFLQL